MSFRRTSEKTVVTSQGSFIVIFCAFVFDSSGIAKGWISDFPMAPTTASLTPFFFNAVPRFQPGTVVLVFGVLSHVLP